MTYYNTKTKEFESFKKSTVPYRIAITKQILDDNETETFVNGGNNTVHVSVISGVKFAFVKCDEMLIEEYWTGNYRVSPGEFWNCDNECYIED